MTKLILKFTVVASLGFILMNCAGPINDAKIKGTWKYEMLEISPNSSGDYWSNFDTCLKQDEFTFNMDGTGTHTNHGMDECPTALPVNYEWSLLDNGTKLERRIVNDRGDIVRFPLSELFNVIQTKLI